MWLAAHERQGGAVLGKDLDGPADVVGLDVRVCVDASNQLSGAGGDPDVHRLPGVETTVAGDQAHAGFVPLAGVHDLDRAIVRPGIDHPDDDAVAGVVLGHDVVEAALDVRFLVERRDDDINRRKPTHVTYSPTR